MTVTVKQIVKPRDCVLAYALPRSRQDYVNDLAAGESKDLVRGIERSLMVNSDMLGWDLKFADQARVAEVTLKRISHLGCRVIYDVKLGDISGLFVDASVVTLFAHWTGDKIELRDGLHEASIIARQIPEDYGGLIDLAVCQSDQLSNNIRKLHYKTLVQSSRKRVAFVLHLLLYELVLQCLSEQPKDFASTSIEVHKKLIKQCYIQSL